MKKLWQIADISYQEWKGFMEPLYHSGDTCEVRDNCALLHAIAAMICNTRNLHVIQHAASSGDYGINSDDFMHVTELADEFNKIYQEWVLQQLKE